MYNWTTQCVISVIANIAPPKIRREAAAIRELTNCRKNARSLLYEQMSDIPVQRLISRRPVWELDPHPSTSLFSINESWLTAWMSALPINGELILDPNSRPPGFDLRRHDWVLLNRFRTNQRRCAFLMHRWGYGETPVCDCGADEQTMHHIVNDCPLRSFPGGLVALNEVTPVAVEYLSQLNLNLWRGVFHD